MGWLGKLFWSFFFERNFFSDVDIINNIKRFFCGVDVNLWCNISCCFRFGVWMWFFVFCVCVFDYRFCVDFWWCVWMDNWSFGIDNCIVVNFNDFCNFFCVCDLFLCWVFVVFFFMFWGFEFWLSISDGNDNRWWYVF